MQLTVGCGKDLASVSQVSSVKNRVVNCDLTRLLNSFETIELSFASGFQLILCSARHAVDTDQIYVQQISQWQIVHNGQAPGHCSIRPACLYFEKLIMLTAWQP